MYYFWRDLSNILQGVGDKSDNLWLDFNKILLVVQ